MKQKITLIPGDGIGPEVVDATIAVLDAVQKAGAAHLEYCPDPLSRRRSRRPRRASVGDDFNYLPGLPECAPAAVAGIGESDSAGGCVCSLGCESTVVELIPCDALERSRDRSFCSRRLSSHCRLAGKVTGRILR